MSEREGHRAGREARKGIAGAPAAAQRHDEAIRRAFSVTFYDVFRGRREQSASGDPGSEVPQPAHDDG